MDDEINLHVLSWNLLDLLDGTLQFVLMVRLNLCRRRMAALLGGGWGRGEQSASDQHADESRWVGGSVGAAQQFLIRAPVRTGPRGGQIIAGCGSRGMWRGPRRRRFCGFPVPVEAEKPAVPRDCVHAVVSPTETAVLSVPVPHLYGTTPQRFVT